MVQVLTQVCWESLHAKAACPVLAEQPQAPHLLSDGLVLKRPTEGRPAAGASGKKQRAAAGGMCESGGRAETGLPA